jgi:2-octaprenyl-6-methoxyphenol hydroxylase
VIETFDIAVVGGGMVGATLSVALKDLGVRVALIEAVAHDSASQPSFDERTTALSNGSRRILETLGVWPAVAPAATPIAKIHVSDQGSRALTPRNRDFAPWATWCRTAHWGLRCGRSSMAPRL